MKHNWWVKEQILNELQFMVVDMNRYNLDEIADALVRRLHERRLTVVPTFLSDEMYEAQKKFDNNLSYQYARGLYNLALDEFASKCVKPVIDEEPGSFW
jgi:hypothetical protein